MDNSIASCGHCHYSSKDPDPEQVVCRRNAPSPLVMSDFDANKLCDANDGGFYGKVTFPVVDRDEWCGEYLKRQA